MFSASLSSAGTEAVTGRASGRWTSDQVTHDDRQLAGDFVLKLRVRSCGAICSGKWIITRRRDTPRCGRWSASGYCSRPESPPGLRGVRIPVFRVNGHCIAAGDALSPAPSPLHFSWSGRRISESQLTRHVHAGIPASRWWPTCVILPGQQGGDFGHDTFAAAPGPVTSRKSCQS